MIEFLTNWVHAELIANRIAKDCDKFVRGPFQSGYTTIPVRIGGRAREVAIKIDGKDEETARIASGQYEFMATVWLHDVAISEYVVVDLRALAESGRLETEGRIKHVRGGGKMLVFTVNELQDWGFLLCGEKYPGMPISFRYITK